MGTYRPEDRHTIIILYRYRTVIWTGQIKVAVTLIRGVSSFNISAGTPIVPRLFRGFLSHSGQVPNPVSFADLPNIVDISSVLRASLNTTQQHEGSLLRHHQSA